MKRPNVQIIIGICEKVSMFSGRERYRLALRTSPALFFAVKIRLAEEGSLLSFEAGYVVN
jgi:hypothetical protein